MALFRKLSPEEEARFRQWARENYQPFESINGTWHPVVQDECRKINEENGAKIFNEAHEPFGGGEQ